MLYDQSQLAIAYLDAFQVTKDKYFAEVFFFSYFFKKKEKLTPSNRLQKISFNMFLEIFQMKKEDFIVQKMLTLFLLKMQRKL